MQPIKLLLERSAGDAEKNVNSITAITLLKEEVLWMSPLFQATLLTKKTQTFHLDPIGRLMNGSKKQKGKLSLKVGLS